MEYQRKLGISEEDFEDILDDLDHRRHKGLEYRHLPDYRHKIERGTVLIEGEVIRGFPKIPRTLNLENGIPRHFDGDVVVEEKMNGYNTRIAKVKDEVFAFTRGGIICPFTTHKARKMLPVDEFLSDNPGLMICCEAIGPENPYTTYNYPEVNGFEFRVFDVRECESGESLKVEERHELCDAYGMPNVRLFGVYDTEESVEEVPEIIKRLDDEEREGVVMKSRDASQQLKYTTSSANQGNLAYAFALLFDYGQDFMFRRIIREAFQSVEWEESGEEATERAHELGEAILLSSIDTIKKVQRGEEVGEEHTIRGEHDVIEETIEHLKDQGLKIVIQNDRKENGERVVDFMKRMQSSNDKTKSYLDGKIVKE
ncbi:MAG: RNA ligase [Halobacteria archaeon]|nr:RNA ligase [Halobacteria archaeon]